MKTLILLRHGEPVDGLDIENSLIPLTPDGSQTVRIMAKLFTKRSIIPDNIISASETKSFDTAKIFSKDINFPEKLIQKEDQIKEGTSLKEIIHYIRKIDRTINNLILIAHNPLISQLASTLCRDFTREMPLTSILGLQFEIRSWNELHPDQCKFLFYNQPS